MAEVILVTPRSLTRAPVAELDRLRAQGYALRFSRPGATPSEPELLDLVPGCVGWIAGVEPVSARVIDAAAGLRAISRNGVGTDSLPMELLRARGIRVATAAGSNAGGVAELALGLMLAAARAIPACDAGIKAGGWPRPMGREIASQTVGLIGCGMIGQRLVRLLGGFGARILAFDPGRPPLPDAPPGFAYASLDEVLAEADILSLHCPMPADGRPLLDAARLARLRPGAILVNTARAGLVEEAALLTALEEGRIAAYGVDVFAAEPPRCLRLAGHPAVIATSHIGGLTADSVTRATRAAVDGLLAALTP